MSKVRLADIEKGQVFMDATCGANISMVALGKPEYIGGGLIELKAKVLSGLSGDHNGEEVILSEGYDCPDSEALVLHVCAVQAARKGKRS